MVDLGLTVPWEMVKTQTWALGNSGVHWKEGPVLAGEFFFFFFISSGQWQ